MSSSASDFYALTEVLGEVGSIEDFIFDGFGAIDGKLASDFGFDCLFLGLPLDFGFFRDGGGGGWLFCGHEN